MSSLPLANAYYSNRIEGHVSRLVDIERGMREMYVADPRQRDLQREARAHVEGQQLMRYPGRADAESVTEPEREAGGSAAEEAGGRRL